MSRIGKLPVAIPKGVKVDVDLNNLVKVHGPKGELEKQFHKDLKISLTDGTILVERPGDGRLHRSLHGLTRTLIANMVSGVTEGFHRVLLITGMGYRVAKQGQALQIQVGYSHPVSVAPPEGISFDVEGNNKIIVRGIDKQQVGQIAANIRSIRPPEPYKGKGIRREGEVVRRKMGKAGKTAKK